MTGIRIIAIILIWIILTAGAFGAPVIPWPRNMAAPGILFLTPETNGAERGGALAHELCHIQQIADGRAREDREALEMECKLAEYFYYESIGYQHGMNGITGVWK